MKNPNAESRISSSKHWHLNKIQSVSLVDGNATFVSVNKCCSIVFLIAQGLNLEFNFSL